MNKNGMTIFSLRHFVFVIFFEIYVITGVFLSIVLIMFFYIFYSKPIYQAKAYIIVKPIIDSRKLPFTDKNFFKVEPVTPIDINTELEIITSRELAIDVAKVLNLRLSENKAVKYLTDNMDASSVTASSAIRISKKGANPEEITKIVNTYIDCYINRHIMIHKSNNEINFYENELKRKRQELVDSQSLLIEMIKRNNLINIEEQGEKFIVLLMTLKDELIKNNILIAEKESLVEDAKKKFSIKYYGESEIIGGLNMTAYAPLLLEKAKIISLYKENSTEVININNQVNFILFELNKEKQKIVEQLSSDVKSMKRKKKILEKEIKHTINEAKYLAEIGEKYKDLVSFIQLKRDLYNLYLNKLENERIQEKLDESGVSNISVISKAHVPSVQIFPKKKIMVIVTIIAGIITSVSVGFLSYYIDNTVKKDDDIYTITGLPVISFMEVIID